MEFFELVKEWMEKPLEIQEIGIILIVLSLVLLLMVKIDGYHAAKKAKKFPRQCPNAALIYLYMENQSAMRGKLSCEKGKVSTAFLVPALQHPDRVKGLAFYAAPGVTAVNLMLFGAKKKSDRTLHTGRIAFRAEPDGIYQARIKPGNLTEMYLIKGKEFRFMLPTEEPKSTCRHEMKEVLHPQILRDFHIREQKRLLLTTGGMMIPMGYLVLFAGLPVFALLLPVGLFLLALCAMYAVGSRNFFRTWRELSPWRQEQIQMEFQNPHPIYRLFLGEAHLLSDCLICRQRGKLSLILLEQIVSVRRIQYNKTYGLSSSLMLEMTGRKKYPLEFWGRHQKELPMVLSWIREKNSCVLAE